MHSTTALPKIEENELELFFSALVTAAYEQENAIASSVAMTFFCYLQNATIRSTLVDDIHLLKTKGVFLKKLADAVVNEIIRKITVNEMFVITSTPAVFLAKLIAVVDQVPRTTLTADHVEKFYLVIKTIELTKHQGEEVESKAADNAKIAAESLLKYFLTDVRPTTLNNRLQGLKQQQIFAGLLPAWVVEEVIEQVASGAILPLLENRELFCRRLQGKAEELIHNAYKKIIVNTTHGRANINDICAVEPIDNEALNLIQSLNTEGLAQLDKMCDDNYKIAMRSFRWALAHAEDARNNAKTREVQDFFNKQISLSHGHYARAQVAYALYLQKVNRTEHAVILFGCALDSLAAMSPTLQTIEQNVNTYKAAHAGCIRNLLELMDKSNEYSAKEDYFLKAHAHAKLIAQYTDMTELALFKVKTGELMHFYFNAAHANLEKIDAQTKNIFIAEEYLKFFAVIEAALYQENLFFQLVAQANVAASVKADLLLTFLKKASALRGDFTVENSKVFADIFTKIKSIFNGQQVETLATLLKQDSYFSSGTIVKYLEKALSKNKSVSEDKLANTNSRPMTPPEFKLQNTFLRPSPSRVRRPSRSIFSPLNPGNTSNVEVNESASNSKSL